MEASVAAGAAAAAAAASAPNPPLAEAPPPSTAATDAQRATESEEDETTKIAQRWASLLSSARAEAQAAFLLRRVGACPRCCLRFAGVRDAAAFAPPAPSSAALLAELIGSAGGGEGEGEGKEEEEEGERESPCSVCLGVLQSPEPSFRLPLPSDKMAAAAASLDMGAGAWVAAESGSGESVAAVVERQGHASKSASSLSSTSSAAAAPPPPRVVSLQVSFPASVGLRQAAASAALAAAGLPPAKPAHRSSCGGGRGSSSSSALGPDSITDVKDAAKAAVSPALARALGGGARVTAANDDAASLTVSLQYVHPATAGELERYFPALVGGKRSRRGGRGSVFVPSGGGSDGKKGCWKKRKRVPAADCAALGRAASQALVAGCGALDLAALQRAGFPVPPPRPPSSGGDSAAAAAASEGAAPHLLVRARAAPLFVGGRYLKLQRDVSQSPFFDEKGDRRGRTSVQEEIERVVLPLFGGQKVEGEAGEGGEEAAAAATGEQGDEASQQRPGGCDGCKFITAGREDLDVRCLGKGRPFVLEIANARLRGGGPPSQKALDGAREKLRESACGVELDALSMVGKKELVAIKEGETSKQKSYEALCWLPVEVDDAVLAAVNGAVRRAEEEEEGGGGEGAGENKSKGKKGKGLVLQQTTPARVEHRRAMLVRPRAIHEMSAVRVPGEPQQLLLRLRTQAGLYVKEFVHGDGGRTVPSLVDVAGVREKLLEEKRKRKRQKDLPAAAANDAAPAAAAAPLSSDADFDAEEEIEAAKCLSLDVCEIHLDFL